MEEEQYGLNLKEIGKAMDDAFLKSLEEFMKEEREFKQPTCQKLNDRLRIVEEHIKPDRDKENCEKHMHFQYSSSLKDSENKDEWKCDYCGAIIKRVQSQKALDELVKQAQELKMGYDA